MADRSRAGRRPLPAVVAASDCERCRPGLVTQPVNTLSSLAYVAAGAHVVRAARRRPERARPGTRAVGLSLVAVGLGSVAYHGPGGRAGRWAHDASLLAMAGLVTLADLRHARGAGEPTVGQVAAVSAAAAVAGHPSTSSVAQAVTAAAALGAEVSRSLAGARREGRRQRHDATGTDAAAAAEDGAADASDGRTGVLALALLAGGLGLHAAGRTGRPLCRPDSRLQAHGAWHVLSALALWLRTRPAA